MYLDIPLIKPSNEVLKQLYSISSQLKIEEYEASTNQQWFLAKQKSFPFFILLYLHNISQQKNCEKVYKVTRVHPASTLRLKKH